ncbi:MAG TPA: ATP-binding protein [Bryobacteraceae bacterium]|jgi:nitrogen fixation/metabolism regulation signal transduction histidine kinase|nr:ATP-binding protein [Bryobacteraceae bacterium]
MRLQKPKVVHEWRISCMALMAGLPAVVTSLVILWTRPCPPLIQWMLSLLILGFWCGFAAAIKERVASPLRTLANLLEAMREGDYSIRARAAQGEDALGDVMQQLNAMGATLQAQRLGALEAATLLRKVMEEIDVAVFAFDSAHRLRLVNRAGERLLSQPSERLLNSSAESLNLSEFLEGEETRTVQRAFPGATGRWGVSRSMFREGGLPHQLLVISDLTRPLREEELQAWQRLVRVLGHELNNSLTPIKSIAGSLEGLLAREPRPPDWEEDMRRGLAVIAARSEALSRFTGAYARLAKLPRPQLRPVDVAKLIEQVLGLETRLRPVLRPGPEIVILADSDQLEQLLINIIRNGVDAALETGGGVEVGWARRNSMLEIWVHDEGPGISNMGNLFVPFFTTKPGGSGIGLVLSRQIAEAHGGSLTLQNRPDGRGCEARLRLPI